MTLVRLERITKLGRLGEDLVAELLHEQGFTDIENLNRRRQNYPFGLPSQREMACVILSA